MRLCARALVLALVCVCGAHPHGRARSASDAQDAQDALLAPKVVRLRDKQDEPSCEQLKYMWRFSKRQARAPEIVNEISKYKDPFTYNEWPAVRGQPLTVAPRYRGSNSFVGPYGRLIITAPAGSPRSGTKYEDSTFFTDRVFAVPHRPNSDIDLRFPGHGRALPVAPPQQGRFDELKKMIQNERARELQSQRIAEDLAARAAVLKDMAAGGARREDMQQGIYSEQEQRRLQDLQIPVADEPQPRRQRPTVIRQYGRYPDMVPIPERRALVPLPLHYLDEYPDSLADLMTAYF